MYRLATQTGFFERLRDGIAKSFPFFSVLNEGTDSYNYETERFDLVDGFGLGVQYFVERENMKWYYDKVPFFADCVNMYADFASQVQIREVDMDGNDVSDSRFLEFLEHPNEWQDQIAFIKEFVINTLTTGIGVQYGTFFRTGNLSVSPSLYNVDAHNLKPPKVKNPYNLTREQIGALEFIERLGHNYDRKLRLSELVLIYDQVSSNGYGGDDTGYSADRFLNPISRTSSLLKDFQVLLNSTDTMAYLTGNNVNFVVSKEMNNTTLAPLGSKEKMDIEKKLGGKGRYGSRSGKIGDVIATNETLRALNLQRNNKNLYIIEMQNNAKENIRTRLGVPRDLLDGFNGANSGSTYENQQFAEARFILNNVKNITDSWLYGLEKKSGNYFKSRGTKLIGTYDHLASVIATKGMLKHNAMKKRADAISVLLDSYSSGRENGTFTGTFEDFLDDLGFSNYIHTDNRE